MTIEQMNKMKMFVATLNKRIEMAELDVSLYESEYLQRRSQAMLDAYMNVKDDLLFFFDELNK